MPTIQIPKSRLESIRRAEAERERRKRIKNKKKWK